MIDVEKVNELLLKSFPSCKVIKKEIPGTIHFSLDIKDQNVFAKLDVNNMASLLTICYGPGRWTDTELKEYMENMNNSIENETKFHACLTELPEFKEPQIVLDTYLAGYQDEMELATMVLKRLLTFLKSEHSNLYYNFLVYVRLKS